MGIRLKQIFNQNEVKPTIQLHFKNETDGEAFHQCLKKVWETGETQTVYNVQAVTDGLEDGLNHYTQDNIQEMLELQVGPAMHEKDLPIDTEYGVQSLHINYYTVNAGFVCQTEKDSVVFCKVFFQTQTEQCTVSYHLKPYLANSIEEIVLSYATICSFIKELCDANENKDEQEEGNEFVKSIESELQLYKMIWDIEKMVKVHFNPGYLKDIDDKQWEECLIDIYELYYGLVEKKVIRLLAKLTSTNSTAIYLEKNKKIKKGSNVELTFSGTSSYNVFGKTISMYTANLLTNAIVKEVIEDSKERLKIIYSDTDSNPMYISYMVFVTEDEALQEVKNIMNHVNDYKNAKTVLEQIKGA